MKVTLQFLSIFLFSGSASACLNEFGQTLTGERIRSLNTKRTALGIDELPYEFKNMLKIGKIDPELLIQRLSDLEENQYMQNSVLLDYQDSLHLLKEELSTHDNSRDETITKGKSATNQKKGSTSFGFYALFTFGGLLIGFIVAKMLHRPERK
jgi:hypothetical protein